MSQTLVQNTAGTVISTLQVGQVDTTTTSLSLVGQGVSPYAGYTANNFVKLLENFANLTPPPNPVNGQLWYDSTPFHPRLSMWTLNQWVTVGLGVSSAFVGLRRLNSALNVDFTVAGAVPLATVSSASFRYHPTAVMLVPPFGATNTAVSPPTFNLFITTSGDVMADTVVTNFIGAKHAFYIIQGATRFMQNGDTMSLNISAPAAGGTLHYDAYVFAFQTITGL